MIDLLLHYILLYGQEVRNPIARILQHLAGKQPTGQRESEKSLIRNVPYSSFPEKRLNRETNKLVEHKVKPCSSTKEVQGKFGQRRAMCR